LDAQAVCDAVDVCVVGGDRADIKDVSVGESHVREGFDIGFDHVPRRQRQLLDIGEHGQTLVAQVGVMPV
jgi:hypothetical protein